MSRRSSDSSPAVPPRDQLIAIGIIRKAHGVHGEASTEPLTDSPERFDEIEHVYLVSPDESQIKAATIEASRAHLGRALIQFKEISSPEELRDYYNWTIEIHESEARKLDENEYFLHDLVGLAMVTPEGVPIGRVTDVNEGGGGLMLTVEPASGKPFDVPFAAGICTEIDIEQKRIVAELPAGLANLDEVEETGEAEKPQKKRRPQKQPKRS